MRPLLISVVLVVGCSRGPAPIPPSVAPALPSLDGEWRCVKLSIDGEKLERLTTQHFRLSVDKGTWREESRGEVIQELSIQVVAPDVIRFDLGDGTWFLGRFRLSGDELTVAYPGPIDGDRPLPPRTLEPGKDLTVGWWKRLE